MFSADALDMKFTTPTAHLEGLVFKHEYDSGKIKFFFTKDHGQIHRYDLPRRGIMMKEPGPHDRYTECKDWNGKLVTFSDTSGTMISMPVSVELTERDIAKFSYIKIVDGNAFFYQLENPLHAFLSHARYVVRHNNICYDSSIRRVISLADLVQLDTICLFVDFSVSVPLDISLCDQTEVINGFLYCRELYPNISHEFDITQTCAQGTDTDWMYHRCFVRILGDVMDISTVTKLNISEVFTCSASSALMACFSPTDQYVRKYCIDYYNSEGSEYYTSCSVYELSKYLMAFIETRKDDISPVLFSLIKGVSQSWRILSELISIHWPAENVITSNVKAIAAGFIITTPACLPEDVPTLYNHQHGVATVYFPVLGTNEIVIDFHGASICVTNMNIQNTHRSLMQLVSSGVSFCNLQHTLNSLTSICLGAPMSITIPKDDEAGVKALSVMLKVRGCV